MTGTLLDSIEEAFRLAVKSIIGDAADVYTGKSPVDKVAPCVICSADGSTEEDPPRTGNYWVNVDIAVKHTAATEASDTVNPRDDSISLLKSVFDILRINDLPTLINAQGQDLTVFPEGAFFDAPRSERDELGIWVDTMTVRLYCCPSVLTP